MAKILASTTTKTLLYTTLTIFITFPLSLNSTALSQTNKILLSNNTQIPTKNAPVDLQRLWGKWETQGKSGTKLILTFTQDGKLLLALMGAGNSAINLPTLYYHANTTTKPMQIDLKSSDNQQTILTIFGFTDNGQLKLQMDGIDSSKPRPSKFADNALILNKLPE
jgi:hypothetical protein